MALWTRDDVRLIAPEMSVANGVSDATVDAYIAIADKQIDPDVFGELTKEAGAYLTAHLLKCDGYGAPGSASGTGAPVSGVTVGRVSVQYSDPTSSGMSSDLARSRYGQSFSRLVRLSCPTPIVL